MEAVNLRIKSPSARLADMHLVCSVTDTVREVKSRIEFEFPTHPRPEAQKLVYAGKLLADQAQLLQVLRFEDECSTFTIHLVCQLGTDHSRPGVSQPDSDPPVPTTTSSSRQQDAGLDDGAAASVAVADEELAELVRVRELIETLGRDATGLSVDQQASLQQVYTQYLQLSQQYLQNHGQLPAAEGTVVTGIEQQQQPPANPQAAGGVNLQEEGAEGDLLDRLYGLTRVALLLSVIYFHSSFFRLLLVAVITLFTCYFQNNRLNRRAHRQPQRNNNNRHVQINNNGINVENDPGDLANNINGGERDESVEEVAGDVAEDGVEEEEEYKPNILVVAFTFVSTFFSSIIPSMN